MADVYAGESAHLVDANGANIASSNPLPVSQVVGGAGLSPANPMPVLVSGLTSDGAAPTNPALNVAGVDGGGLKRSLLTDTNGTVFESPRHSSTDWTTTVAISGSTAASTVKAAAGAGVRNYITGFQATNNGTVACLAQIMDGAGAVLAFFWLPANATVAVSVAFQTPLRTPANSAVTVNVNQASAGLLANLQGYTA